MKSQSLRDKIQKLPRLPGVYIFKDIKGKIIYVGKAKDLKRRVNSYFHLNLDSTSKTYALVKKITDISIIEVKSEFEALILEAELIKKYNPHYNIVLKDDKSYIYIVIRNEKVKINSSFVNLPKILTARKTQILEKDTVFGPYPSSDIAKQILKVLRKVFMFRDCSVSKFSKYHTLGTFCLFGHINLCSGPCVKNSLDEIKTYKLNMVRIKNILKGGTDRFVEHLEGKMRMYSRKEEYEKAANIRDTLQRFSFIRRDFTEAEKYMDNPYLLSDMQDKALEELQNFLPILNIKPKRIECYDISNLSGKEAVGSMVVATKGQIDKSEYKRFKIKLKNTPDDFGMMYEVLSRRFEGKSKWKSPDLVVVDGGRPQVSAANKVLEDIPVVGLAKKHDHIVFEQNKEFIEKEIEKSNLGMKLLIELRDESHRFAQKYHHLLRKKRLEV